MAPILSIIKTVKSIKRTKFKISPTLFAFLSSFNNILVYKVIFCPANKNTIEEKVITPKPPICIKVMRITSPKGEKTSDTSTTDKPVTQTADTTVKRASKKFKLFPSCKESGNINRKIPIKMTNKKPKINFREGEIGRAHV